LRGRGRFKSNTRLYHALQHKGEREGTKEHGGKITCRREDVG